jgi:hypothetical protein
MTLGAAAAPARADEALVGRAEEGRKGPSPDARGPPRIACATSSARSASPHASRSRGQSSARTAVARCRNAAVKGRTLLTRLRTASSAFAAGHMSVRIRNRGASSGWCPDVTAAARRQARPMSRYLASTLRAQERNARRRYQAAVAAALEALRRAEQHFDEASAAIDAHIRRARPAAADRALPGLTQATRTSTARETTDASTTTSIRSHAGRSIPSPVPSGSVQ